MPLTVPSWLRKPYLVLAAQSTEIPVLDSYRGLAIILVLTGHFFINYADSNQTWLYTICKLLGQLGVILFYTLSGFLISRWFLNRYAFGKAPTTFRYYFRRRALRIFPLYYITLLVALLYGLVYSHSKNLPANGYLNALGFCLLLIQNLDERYVDWLNPPSWSVAVELHAYILLFLLFRFIRPPSTKKTIAIGFVVLAVGLLLKIFVLFLFKDTTNLHINLYGHTLTNLPYFLPGIILALLFFDFNNKTVVLSNQHNKYAWIILIACVILLSTSISLNSTNTAFYIVELAALGFSAILFLAIHSRNNIFEKIQNPLLAFIGKISYSLYLWDNFISNISIPISRAIFSSDAQVPKTLMRLILLLIVGCLSYYFIERPFLELKKKI